MTPRSRSWVRGQASVEFALVVPLILVVLMAVAQVTIAGYAQIAVVHVSREIAREMAVNPSADPEELAEYNGLLGPDGLHVSVYFDSVVQTNREIVRVEVSYRIPLVFRIFSPIMGEMTVRSEVEMLVES